MLPLRYPMRFCLLLLAALPGRRAAAQNAFSLHQLIADPTARVRAPAGATPQVRPGGAAGPLVARLTIPEGPAATAPVRHCAPGAARPGGAPAYSYIDWLRFSFSFN